jgi:hypothetical protein
MMAQPLEFRVRKLARMSSHYRELAHGLLAPDINAEIEAVAEECAREAARLERECLGKRNCPCKLSGRCLSRALASHHLA